jgi:hypothetical protein
MICFPKQKLIKITINHSGVPQLDRERKMNFLTISIFFARLHRARLCVGTFFKEDINQVIEGYKERIHVTKLLDH